MGRIWGVALAVTLVAQGERLFAADAPKPEAVIERALQAEGGADKVAKYNAATWKTKGTFHGMGTPIEYTGEFAVQLPDKQRTSIEGDMNDQKFKMTQVINGDKAWVRMNDNTMEMQDEQAAEQKQQMYTRRVTRLVGLTGGEFQLSSLPPAEVHGKPAVGVKVSSKGHTDISLYFDKDSGLLVKSQMKAKNPQTGDDVDQESFYEDYQDIDGVKQPMKVTVHREGKVFLEGKNSDMKLLEKLDEKTFEEPK